MSRVSIEIFGGIEVIGSSKIMISTPSARVLLDMGLDIPSDADLFRAPVVERPGRELADRLAVGMAPAMPGIYDPTQLPDDSPLAIRDERPTAIFLSHAHIDHDGALGFARLDIPVHAHPDTVRLEQAVAAAGLAGPGHPVVLQPMTAPVQVGDLLVKYIPVDHDIPGACGFLMHTPDGTLAYSGDLNFHRGSVSDAFVERVAGVDMLVVETTMLSFDEVRPLRPEPEVFGCAAAELDRSPGLALLSMYERDADRAAAMIEAAADRGRTLVWPGQQAALLHHFGVQRVVTWDASRPQRTAHGIAVGRVSAEHGSMKTVSLQQVHQAPSHYVVQPDADDAPALLDLPRIPGAYLPFIHAQGEPLGPFMPNWQTWIDWLAALSITYVGVGSSGHATGEALHKMVADIHPGMVVPIHGFRPRALQVDVPTLIAQYGKRYALDGSVLD